MNEEERRIIDRFYTRPARNVATHGTWRDYQRAKLYRAERAAWSRVGQGRSLDSVRRIEAYVHAIQGSSWYKGAPEFSPPHRPLRIHDGRGHRNAKGGRTRLTLPRWARTEAVILHELAHASQPWPSSSHGREFCRAYLRLVKELLGKEHHAVYRSEFRKHGVKLQGTDRDHHERVARRRARRAAVKLGLVAARPSPFGKKD